jgi:hypothetical protein
VLLSWRFRFAWSQTPQLRSIAPGRQSFMEILEFFMEILFEQLMELLCLGIAQLINAMRDVF